MDNTGQQHQLPTPPPYLVYPVSWRSIDKHYLSNRTCVTDFGGAFRCTEPPKELGIPPPYRAPEIFLEKDRPDLAGFSTDLWALGCTIFEIRTGRKLFSSFDDDDDSYLDEMVEILCIMPEPWWSSTCEGRAQVYSDKPDEFDRAVFVRERSGVMRRQRQPTIRLWRKARVHSRRSWRLACGTCLMMRLRLRTETFCRSRRRSSRICWVSC